MDSTYGDEWIGPGSLLVRCSSPVTFESIPETEVSASNEEVNDFSSMKSQSEGEIVGSENGVKGQDFSRIIQRKDDPVEGTESGEKRGKQQEYFVPWHLPYHRAEVSGASAGAVENGLARKDDKKGAIVYDRYHHVFGEGELERSSMCLWDKLPFPEIRKLNCKKRFSGI